MTETPGPAAEFPAASPLAAPEAMLRSAEHLDLAAAAAMRAARFNLISAGLLFLTAVAVFVAALLLLWG